MEWWKGLSLLSSHLTCQHEVEQVVRAGGKPVSSKASKNPQPAKQGTVCGFSSLVTLVLPGCRVSCGKESVFNHPPSCLYVNIRVPPLPMGRVHTVLGMMV